MRNETQSAVLTPLATAPGTVQTLRPVVVVLGAHRAGTSLLMNVLDACGVSAGPNLLGADEWNAGGYWEVEEIFQTQDRILETLGRSWERVEGVDSLPSDWTLHEEIAPFREHLIEIVRRELRTSPGTWGFKDPRTATLLPLWQEVFEELGLEPIYVLAVRHPMAVARSLRRRNGFPDPHSQLLWLRTYVDALRHTAGGIHAVVEYERWFTQPEGQLASVLEALDGLGDTDRATLRAAVRPLLRSELQHHVARRDESCHPVVARLYRWLRAAAADPEMLHDAAFIEAIGEQAHDLGARWQIGQWGDRYYPINLIDEIPHATEGAGGADVWNVELESEPSRCLFAQPPARVCVQIPDGSAGKLRFAVGMHPEVWNNESSGECMFTATVDDRVKLLISLDTLHRSADRRWHRFELDVPESGPAGHSVVLETRHIGGNHSFRWALFEEPVFECSRH